MTLAIARAVFIVNGLLCFLGALGMTVKPAEFVLGRPDPLGAGAKMFAWKYSLLLATNGIAFLLMYKRPDHPSKRFFALSNMIYNFFCVVGIIAGIFQHPPAAALRGGIMNFLMSLYIAYYLYMTSPSICHKEKEEESKKE